MITKEHTVIFHVETSVNALATVACSFFLTKQDMRIKSGKEQTKLSNNPAHTLYPRTCKIEIV